MQTVHSTGLCECIFGCLLYGVSNVSNDWDLQKCPLDHGCLLLRVLISYYLKVTINCDYELTHKIFGSY